MRSNRIEDGVDGEGRRIGPRRPMLGEVSLFDETGQPIVLETIDVGPRGIFVRSDLLLDLGEELWVSLKLPNGPKLVVRGRIVRGQLGSSDEPAGMGIAFVDITAREESWLRRFIREREAQGDTWTVVNPEGALGESQSPAVEAI